MNAELTIAVVLGLLYTGAGLSRLLAHRSAGQGDVAHGIVIFVEPVRWLFLSWGFPSVVRGVRWAGRKHHIEIFRWSGVSGSLFVVPDLVAQQRLLWQSQRLTRRLNELRRQHPHVPIHLVAYSSGCYIALEACKQMNPGELKGMLSLLSPAVSSTYDLTALKFRVTSVRVFHSKLDVINGIGTLIFGTNDRRFQLSSGVVGFHNPPDFVEQHAWRPEDVRLRYFGDHFTVTSPWLIQRCIASHL